MARLIRVGVFSFAKFQAIFMGIGGFILGFFSVMLSGTRFAPIMPALGIDVPAAVTMLVFLPIIYALFGFVSGMILAFFFNFVLSSVGGIKFEMEKGYKEE